MMDASKIYALYFQGSANINLNRYENNSNFRIFVGCKRMGGENEQRVQLRGMDPSTLGSKQATSLKCLIDSIGGKAVGRPSTSRQNNDLHKLSFVVIVQNIICYHFSARLSPSEDDVSGVKKPLLTQRSQSTRKRDNHLKNQEKSLN